LSGDSERVKANIIQKETMSDFGRFKHYNDLLLLHIFFALVCIPTSGKMIDVFGTPLSVSIFYFPFIYIVADLLTEVYGYAAARRVVWYGVIAQVAATLVFAFVSWYPPAASFTHNEAYRDVLSTAPQLVLFGTVAVFLGDISNNYVLARMKVLTQGRAQGFRFVISTVVGQGVNTAFFYTFGLWGLLSSSFLVQSIALASVAKILVEVVMLPVTIRTAEWLKDREKVDVFDTETDFNPLKF
jgi:uncharacterized integral membrane protein (TIGR00697 family)